MANNNRKIIAVWIYELRYGLSYETLHYFPTLMKHGEVSMFPLESFSDACLMDTVLMQKPDLMFFKLYRDWIQPETIRYITKDMGIKTIGHFGDDEKYFDDGDCQTQDYANCFDTVLTTYKPALVRYTEMGIQARHFQYGANHKLYKRQRVKRSINISFVGDMRPHRVHILNYLVYHKLEPKVWGTGWRGQDNDTTILTTEQYIQNINKTKINLNVSKDFVNEKEVHQIKGRDFEIPMCGGFLLTGYSELLKEHFKFGKEIETYSDVRECLDKCKFYLSHDSARERIAAAGYARAHKEHTYEQKFKELFKSL